jgi:hypothetical protein
MTKTQTIYVTLHNGKSVRVQIPASVKDDMAIQFTLNSRFGHQGWSKYKIRETKPKYDEKETT